MSPERFILTSMLLNGLASPGWRASNPAAFQQLVQLSGTPLDIAVNMTPDEAIAATDRLERLRSVRWETKSR